MLTLVVGILMISLLHSPAMCQEERLIADGDLPEIQGIFSSDAIVRLEAFNTIQHRIWTGEQAATIADALAKKLDHNEDIGAAGLAVIRLSRSHAVESQEAVRALERLCDISKVRRHHMTEGELCSALRALGGVDPGMIKAKLAVQRIVKASDEFPYASAWAAGVLAKIEPDEPKWLETLLMRLRTQPTHVFVAALGEAGPAARGAIPQLKTCLETATSPGTKAVAAVAIVRIDESQREAMFELLSDIIQQPLGDVILEPTGPSPPGLDHRAYISGALGEITSTESRDSIIRHFQPLQNSECPDLQKLVRSIIEHASNVREIDEK